MASVNKVILIGHLGKDPEIRFMPNGEKVAQFSIATTDTWKDKNGEKQEKTEWHRIVLYRKLAEIAEEYVKKGSQVYIEGRLETKKYTDKSSIERYITQIIGDKLKMLDKRPGGQSDSSSTQAGAGRSNGTGFEDIDDDIPF